MFICLASKYLWGTYHEPGSILDILDISMPVILKVRKKNKPE